LASGSHFWGVIVFLVALSLRLVYLAQIRDSPLFDFPVVDGRTYADLARAMAVDGAWRGPPGPFWQPPLYPYFLGLLWTLSGGVDWLLPRLAQAVLGALSCVLVWRIGTREFSPGIGVAASLGACLWAPFILFDGELLPATLAVFLDLVALEVLLCTGRRATPGSRNAWSLLAGVMLGLASLCVGNMLAVMPVAIIWLYRDRRWQVARWQAPVLLICGVVLAITPVTARNLVVADEFVLVSTNAGVNAFIGNNAGYDETLRIQPGKDWLELVLRPRLEGGAETASAQSRWFLGEAAAFARTQPWAWLRLVARKGYHFVHGTEVGRNMDLYPEPGTTPLLGALMWRHGVVMPLGLMMPFAVVGLLLGWRRRYFQAHGPRLLLWYLFVYAGTVVAFFPSARYRLPVIPILLLLAAVGGRELWRLRGSGAPQLALPVGVFCVVALGVNVGGPDPSPVGIAQTEHRLGFVFQQKGMLANAARHYRTALEQDPTIGEARYNLGAIYAEQGRYDRAVLEFRRFVEGHSEEGRHSEDGRQSEDFQGRLALGDAYLRAQRPHEASVVYSALMAERELAAAHESGRIAAGPVQIQGRLAAALAHAGKLLEATQAYEELLQLQPDSLQARLHLGRVLEARDLPAGAREQYELVLREAPDNTEVRHRLAYILFQAGQPEEAKLHLERLLARDPAAVASRWLLASQLVAEHRSSEALVQVQAILALQPDHQGANWVSGHLHTILGDTTTGAAHIDRLKQLHREQRQGEIAENLKQEMRDVLGAQ
jgi:tetratricopeptide (TPR) repeat protein